MKIGTTLSHDLYLVRSTGWMMPRGTVYMRKKNSVSAMSSDSGWVTSRLSSAAWSAFCISILKPRSSLALRPMSMIAE